MTTRLLTAALVAALSFGAPALAAPKPATTAAFHVDKARLDKALAAMVRAAAPPARPWSGRTARTLFRLRGLCRPRGERPMTRDTLVQI